MEVKRIAILDNEPAAMDPVAVSFKLSGYFPQLLSSAEVCRFLAGSADHLEADLFILDPSLRCGSKYRDAETQNGLLGGFFLARDLQRTNLNVPIVFFSNALIGAVTSEAWQVIHQLQNCTFLQKREYPPFELVRFVDRYFERGRFTSGRWRRFLESLPPQSLPGRLPPPSSDTYHRPRP